MKIAVFSTKSHDRDYLDKCNAQDGGHQLTYFDAGLNSETAKLTAGFEGVCVFVNDDVNRDVIGQLSLNGIRLIALRCAGYNNVDMACACEKGITIVNVPAYSPQAVAEHAVALILTLSRKTHKAYNRVKEGNFSLEKLAGFNLYGKTVAVIGTGRIGSAFCEIMLGFGCKVIACDIKESDKLKSKGVVYKALGEILRDADIISLHCPLNNETRHLLNGAAFDQMKDGAMVINTSRGGLLDTAAAVASLKQGKLGYLGIDVYEMEANLFFRDLSERIIQDDLIERLMSFHNVLITPHQGFLTKEALLEIATTTLGNFTSFENGSELTNAVKATT